MSAQQAPLECGGKFSPSPDREQFDWTFLLWLGVLAVLGHKVHGQDRSLQIPAISRLVRTNHFTPQQKRLLCRWKKTATAEKNTPLFSRVHSPGTPDRNPWGVSTKQMTAQESHGITGNACPQNPHGVTDDSVMQTGNSSDLSLEGKEKGSTRPTSRSEDTDLAIEEIVAAPHSRGRTPDANHYGPTTEKNPEDLQRFPSAATTIDFPEGGIKGWLVVFGSFCAMISLYGLINSSAVFESYFSENQLKDHSPSEIGWIFSLYLFIVFFVGVQVGPIFDHFGARALVAVGSLMIVLSLLLLSWCTKYYQIILTYSVLGGLGGALLNCPAYGAIAHFFNVRRGLATGIATTAGGIGGVIFPVILRELLPGVGFGWSSRILAFIMLGLAIPANLFIQTRLPPAKHEKMQSVWPDFTVFKDLRFTFASLGIFFMEWGLFIPLTYIVSYAADHGEDATESYLLLSYLNAGSVVGRVLPGLLADKIGRFNVIIITIALCVITVLAIWLPAGTSNAALIAYSVLFGFASGSNLGLVPVCIGQLCDHRRFGRLYSTAMMMASFGTLSSVPIGGALLDIKSGNGWTAVICFSGVSYCVALGCYITSRTSSHASSHWRVILKQVKELKLKSCCRRVMQCLGLLGAISALCAGVGFPMRNHWLPIWWGNLHGFAPTSPKSRGNSGPSVPRILKKIIFTGDTLGRTITGDKMATELSAAPVLSTPADYLFEHATPDANGDPQAPRRSDDELREIYEVSRTVRELGEGKWKKIALQFPDHMLGDAPRLVQLLKDGLETSRKEEAAESTNGDNKGQGTAERIYILADTSYSSCCVDEIAAEHADAQVVVHYGRSCLSPTSRLPVIYVFTQHKLDRDETLEAFKKENSDKTSKVILMADVTYQTHVAALAASLYERGYGNILSTSIIHDPKGIIPNRKLESPTSDTTVATDLDLKEYSIFHISTPPTALLLALSSRVASLYIHATPTSPFPPSAASAQRLLGRRYARLLSLSTAGVIGILVNTLSVSNYLSSVDNIRKQIAAAGKKSYTVVVGKLNPAKLANFAEIEGWVVVGCWESSLVEDDAGFFQPVITPFELEIALQSDDERVWSGEWWGGIEGVKAPEEKEAKTKTIGEDVDGEQEEEDDDDEESAPPEFDLRTGRLVSHSRPMRANGQQKPAASAAAQTTENGDAASEKQPQPGIALALRAKAELAMVNGVVSPGAEYLRSQRTWQGLGSDYAVDEHSTAIEEGRSGVARGYTTGFTIAASQGATGYQ
ncbi:major facilitator superfamily domain-containing protein [Podospora australis]|uniref:S-adenosyl-L-methionine:L-histidine 3-amino-3-carboxypropyltransferase 2 n=1 Tax=Podospora australis TaxID=1536484 RepID=A0AAN6WR78_9PEZI|nr:major facilitator superfamily domain-containing protein [Podospora australis]